MKPKEPRFVAKLILRGGSAWLSSSRSCKRARAAIRSLLAEDGVSEEGLRVLPAGFLLTLTRPEADCHELHVDFGQGIILDVQIHRDFPGALREEVVNRQFLDDFAEGIDRVFSDT